MNQEQKKPQSPEEVKPPQAEVKTGKPPDVSEIGEKIKSGMGMVQVIYGIYDEKFPVAGKSVAYIRKQFDDMYNLAPGAQALVNGEPVSEDTLLLADQTVEFIHQAGTKG